jgi:hypothetical protein
LGIDRQGFNTVAVFQSLLRLREMNHQLTPLRKET